MLFNVTDRQAQEQIGQVGLKRIRDLLKWLEYNDTELRLRPAPSIIVRSEAELFGISSPRFAFRADLKHNGLINLRRLCRFTASVSNHLNISDGISPATLSYTRQQLQDVENTGFCIADAILKPPARLSEYHVLTTDLGRAYGEGSPLAGTPFMQNLRFGSGLCGQSVCFMALALMQEYASNVFGVAELAALASEARQLRGQKSGLTQSPQYLGVSIAGLAADSVEEILTSSAGLASYAQFLMIDKFCNSLYTSDVKTLVETFLRAYLLSGFPVIQKVDLRGFYDIIKANRVPLLAEERKLYSSPIMPHAIVIVGCSPSNKHGRYVLNDPATYPFLEATIEQLMFARNYKDMNRPLGFITVTPIGAKMHLLEVATRRGLFMIANELQRASSIELPRYTGGFLLGEWRLIDFAKPDCLTATDIVHSFSDSMARIRETVQSGWYWVQFIDQVDRDKKYGPTIWLWDASVSSESGKTIRPHVFDVASDNWINEILVSPNLKQTQAVHALKRPAKISASLITSYSTVGVTPAREHVADYALSPFINNPGRLAAEVYFLMEPEIRQWRIRWQNSLVVWITSVVGTFRPTEGTPESATTFLASLAPGQMDEIASAIASGFSKRSVPIIALASFLPEISRAPWTRECSLGIHALANLLHLAQTIRSKGHPLKVVEIVGGSRFRGFALENPKAKDDGPVCNAVQVNASRGRRELLEAIAQSLKLANNTDIKIAIELEPGPCFLINSWDAVKEIAAELDDLEQREPLCGYNRIGFNLDVAHWRLAGITPSDVLGNQSVQKRIFHAHVSGHHRAAHFGDIGLYELNSNQDYWEWCHLFQGLGNSFSGYLSLELEAAKDEDAIQKAVIEFLTNFP